jgi:hypothetical protein
LRWQIRSEEGGPVPQNEQTKSVVPHLRRSIGWLWTQPFRAGLIFGAGPLGLDCKHRFPMFIPPLLAAASQLLKNGIRTYGVGFVWLEIII